MNIFTKARKINGIFLLDKPTGISSNQALQITKKIFSAMKAGHTGSLDPLATGILPICFGEATKFSKYLLKSDKKYRVIAKLGEETSTGDSNGKILNFFNIEFNSIEYNKSLEKLKGEIIQIPPMYSAIKYKGIPLYKYARKGIKVPIRSRLVKVYKLISLYRYKNIIELEILCSSGTYIRSIIENLGKLLKCGAHVVFLRRTKVFSYSSNLSITIDQLNYFKNKYKKNNFVLFKKKIEKFLIPIVSIFSSFPKICLSTNNLFFIKNGRAIKLITKLKSCLICILTKDKKFVGIGKLNKKKYLFPHKLINYNT
ncbi:MAG: tRNA pseudouridine(55) synthase TruB [Buchnera aphidicola (Periphyllus acericola)]|uniref:tRNA pseudouridine(55) synthase TruB n=1 Tax=Buchnera aphidicola TaxID=9 RepID=UPI0030CEBC16|nr:tRNA pseudouridine(55) synthase TruB [Buchnera aphidicola (Periphyllus acericola)]